MNRLRMIGFSFVLLMVKGASAGGLFAPFSLDSASVMPKKVRSVRVLGFTTEIDDKYNTAGGLSPLGSSFDQNVTWNKLMDAQPDGTEKEVLIGGLKDLGIKFDENAGTTRGVVNTRLTVTSPVIAYGVSEKLTLGVAAPVYYSNINVDTGWSASEGFQKDLDRLNASGFKNKVEAVKPKLQNVVSTKIAVNGYEPLQNESKTELGDVTIGAKYQFFKTDNFAAIVAPKLVLPTGRVADANKLVDVPSGDGQWDIGLGSTVEYIANGRLSMNSSVGYVHQLPTHKAKRIPVSSSENLTPDIDNDTFEKLGDVMSWTMGARYKIKEVWTLGTSYSLQYKQADIYSGSQFDGARYDYLEKDTEQVMQAAVAGINFSTIPWFKAGKFLAPLEASLNYSKVLGGRNVNNVSLTSFELAAYF